jgi:hypothetical protein
MDANEKYVRENWQNVKESEYDPHEGYTIPQTRVDFGSHHYTEIKTSDAWKLAAEFTRERREQIRQVEEEIRLLQSMVILLSTERGDETAPVYKRTIARLGVALAELKRGLKETK